MTRYVIIRGFADGEGRIVIDSRSGLIACLEDRDQAYVARDILQSVASGHEQYFVEEVQDCASVTELLERVATPDAA